MPVPKLIRSKTKKKLPPKKPGEPRPKACPRCRARQIKAIQPSTVSGLLVWRCGKCTAVGYGRRVIGDPTSGGDQGALPAKAAYRQNLLKGQK